MKVLKRILIILSSVLTLVAIVILVLFWINDSQLEYLSYQNEGRSYLIRHANIIPMDRDTILRNHDLLIQDGRIERIGKELESNGIPVVEANGAYLLPGLIDMHVHLWDRYELGLYLRHGVTSIRNLWGQPFHLRVKDELVKGKILGPNLFTSGPKLSGPSNSTPDNKPVLTAEEARKLLKDYKARGYDFIKTYNGMTESVFEAVLEESRNLGFDVVCHPTALIDYDSHFQVPVRSIEHAEDIVQQPLEYHLDTLRLKEVVDTYAAHPDIPICPTLVVFHNISRLILEDSILNDPKIQGLNPLIRLVDSKAQFDRWQGSLSYDPDIGMKILDQHAFHLLAIKKIHDAGGTIICGTDAGIGITLPGSSLHQELAFYSKAGITNYEILRTATINAALTHEMMNDLGSIEMGKQADLILVEQDPLKDLNNLKDPIWVMVNGQMILSEDLKRFESEAMDRSNLLVTLVRYVENLLVERY